jgi:hypothetical protein
MLEKPYFNGVDWTIDEKTSAGITVYRHKFETKEQADGFYTRYTEQLKPKGQENKILNRSQSENKGIN